MRVALVNTKMISCCCRPGAHSRILSRRGDISSVRGPAHGIDGHSMAFIMKEIATRERIPDLHSAIKAGGSDPAAIRRPRDGKHPVPLFAGIDRATGESFPDLCRTIAEVASRSDVLAIRRPRNASHKTRMAAISENSAACKSFPYMNASIRIAGSQVVAIRRPRDRKQVARMPPVHISILARCGIPDAHSSVPRSGGDRRAIR